MKFMHLQITCYRAVPYRILSRVCGWLLSKQLPPLIRPMVYNYYASRYNCNLEEAAHEDLTVYKSLAEFFCRPLKDGVRPVSKVDCIVSNLFVCRLNYAGGRLDQLKYLGIFDFHNSKGQIQDIA